MAIGSSDGGTVGCEGGIVREIFRIALLLVGVLLSTVAGARGQDYSGQWTLSSCVEYTCRAFGVPVIEISICSATVADQRPQITIIPGDGSYGSLEGVFTSPTDFEASLVLSGNCVVTYVITGEFTSDTTLAGQFSIQFMGSACAISDCSNQSWTISGMRPQPSCCAGDVGNVDCSAGDGVDIGDLTALIDNLFINFTPLCCDTEANCDGDVGNNIDIGDLTALIDNLFISFAPLPGCQ